MDVKTKLDSICDLERYFKRHPEKISDVPSLELPFECEYCHQPRFDFSMIDGDGEPMCELCFSGMVDVLSADPAEPRPK